ncbi:MAG: hypothetical protein HOP03_01525 [Lysobacter sp.]|nr:hypothetical protein [Lysobacter sp.]
MKPLLFVLTVLLTVAACTEKSGHQATTAPPSKAAPAASPVPPTAASAAVPAASTVPAMPAVETAATFEFAFSSTHADGREGDDPRILRWEDGPCGGSPVVRVSRMPLNDPALAPDYVVEFDDSGKELKRWGKPYEAEVLGLDDDLLKFRVDGEPPRAFWTDLQGRIGTIAGDATTIPELDTPTLECPTLPTFANSSYAFCSIVTDAAGRPRRLAWEGPCT